MNTLINIGMYLTYILFFAAALVLIFFSVKAIVSNAKTAKASLIGVGILLVVFLIAYVISPKNDVPEKLFEKTGTAIAYSKLIGSAMIAMYFMILGVFLTLLYVQISKFLKR